MKEDSIPQTEDDEDGARGTATPYLFLLVLLLVLVPVLGLVLSSVPALADIAAVLKPALLPERPTVDLEIAPNPGYPLIFDYL